MKGVFLSIYVKKKLRLMLWFDQKFRSKYFARNVLNQLKDQAIKAVPYIEERLEYQDTLYDEEIEYMEDIQESINKHFRTLKNHGYDSLKSYANRSDDGGATFEAHESFMEIVRLELTQEDLKKHEDRLKEITDERKSGELVLTKIKHLLSIFPDSNVCQYEDIINFFTENDCDMLLEFEGVMSISSAIVDNYI